MSDRDSSSHDFFAVIENFYEDEAAKKAPSPYVQTHPLEEVPVGDSARPKDAFDPEVYDYKPKIRQFDLNDPAGIEGYEDVMRQCIEGTCILRDEKSSTDRDGNFRALVSWLEIHKKEPTKH